MTEKATFCPRCKHMHVGPCAAPKPKKPDMVFSTKDETLQVKDLHHRAQVFTFEENPVTGKFDKRAYQRDYMRKRRQAQKAKP